MVLAAGDHDWTAVRWISRGLAHQARSEGLHALSAFAERVHHESAKPENVHNIKRSIIRLVGLQGRTSP